MGNATRYWSFVGFIIVLQVSPMTIAQTDRDRIWRTRVYVDGGASQLNPVQSEEQSDSGVLSLLQAASAGDADAVRRLSADIDIDSRNADGFTALHAAVLAGKDEIVKLLLAERANLSSETVSGILPVHTAAYFGHLSIMELLVQAGADIMVKSAGGSTALHFACYGGHHEIAQALLDKGLDIHAVNSHGITPLHAAAFGKGIFDPNEVTSLLRVSLDELAEILSEGDAVVRLLLARGANADAANSEGLTPLHLASMRGALGIVQLLIEKGVALDAEDSANQTALYWAVNGGHLPVARKLVEEGANVARLGHGKIAPLQVLANRKCGLQVSAGAHPWAFDRGYLRKPYQDSISTSPDNPSAELFVSNDTGIAWLWRQDYGEQEEALLALLIDNGADPHVLDSQRNSLLHLAAVNVNPALLAALVGHGLDPDAMNAQSRTPLLMLQDSLSAKPWLVAGSIETLLDNDANIDAQGLDGRTLLHAVACSTEHLLVKSPLLNLLLERGANTAVKDSKGLTAQKAAGKSGNKWAGKLIRNFARK